MDGWGGGINERLALRSVAWVMGWDTESDPIQVSAGLEGGHVAMVWVGNVGGMSGERSGQQLDF